LVNSKSNFYSKRILPPNSAHSAQPACPLPQPWPAGRPNPPRPKPPSPLGLSAGQPAHAISVFYRRRFPLRFTPSRAGLLPLVSLTTGPRLSASSPTSSRLSSPTPPLILGHRAPLRSAPRVPLDHYHLVFISPPLIPLLNLTSSRTSSMSLKTLTLALTAPATSPRRSPDSYKGRAISPSFTAPLPTLISLSPSSSLSLTERRHHHAFPAVARPPRRRSSPGEALDELSVLPSPFCAPAGELRRTGAAGGRAPVSTLSCPLSTSASVHGGPSAPGRSMETWTRSTNLSVGN
jgi:hypothetical protein